MGAPVGNPTLVPGINLIHHIIMLKVPKVGAPVGNPTLIPGIDSIHYIIMPKVPNFPEISDEIPNFHGNLAI